MPSQFASILSILINNPLLLLFLVAAIGYPLGRIRIGGGSLGVAAVLFVGLAFGALDQSLRLPEIVYMLGLVLFVYTVGLSSGASFFASLRGKGLRHNLFALAVIAFTALLVVGVHFALHLRGTQTAGLFAGSLTNTPALAAVLESIKLSTPENVQLLSDPVVTYSLAYPVSVLGMILAIYFAQRLWKVDYGREVQEIEELGRAYEKLENRTILVTSPAAAEVPISELVRERGWDVVFGRVKHNGHVELAGNRTHFRPGDVVTAIGSPEALDTVTAYLGETSTDHIELDRSELDYRRVFVSNHRVAGHRLRDLNLPQQFGAVVTRVRRGDVELLPHADTVLELGDRVRVLTRRDNMLAITRFFGDSYKTISEIDVMSFSLGLALGLLLGLVPFPLPGGITIKLGMAGGPLIVALALGAIERTGPVVWNLPYSANQMLRQLGLILFLAGIGTRAGYDFWRTLTGPNGLPLVAGALVVVVATAVLMLWVGYRVLKVPMGLLAGMLAAVQTQPATLGFALEQAGNDAPNIGYARVFPVAAITKIVVAQLLVTLLS